MTIIKRLVKGSELTHAELDGNFTDLDTRLNSAESTLVAHSQLLQQLPIFAWAVYKAISAVPSVLYSDGISGMSRVSAGLYRLHFSSPYQTKDYGIVISGAPYIAASQYYYPVWDSKHTDYADIRHAAITNGGALIDTFEATVFFVGEK